MDKNKSIDGLVTHRSRQASAARSKAAKTAAKISAKSPARKIPVSKSPEKVEAKVDTDESAKTNSRSVKARSQAEVTEDFLKPVQAFDFDAESGKLEASKESIKQPKPQEKKQKKPVSKKRKIIMGIALFIVVLLIGAVIWFIIWGNDIIAKITGGQGNIFDFFTETYEPLKTDANGRTNILAFGTSGYNMDGDEGNGTHDGAQLTDSIMVISLNQETGDLAMLSLPRDLKTSPTCTATGKINEIYWCNGGGGNITTEEEAVAAGALMTEVGDILDLEFQYYAHLNWASLISIVDTLGGIKITLDEDIEDYSYTEAVFEAGVEYTIDGAQAIGLARARHGTANGDFSRAASQQKILIGIKDRVLEKSLSITDLIDLANTLGDNLRTNFSVNELKTVAHLTSEYDFTSMRQVSLIDPEALVTTSTINGISYVVPSGGVGNYTRIQKYVAKMFSSDSRDYEDASILVLNNSDTAGLASVEQAALTEAGYHNIEIDNVVASDLTEQYTLYVLNDAAPGTKKMLEERYNQTAHTADELPAEVSRDYDFVLIVNSAENQE